MLNAGLTGMLRSFARLPNLRRAPGPEGQLKYTVMGPFRVYMNTDWSNFSPWPTSLLRYEKANGSTQDALRCVICNHVNGTGRSWSISAQSFINSL